jgi:hypothetical protein
MKKAQITLFIILGVILLAAVGMIFYLNSRNIDLSLNMPQEAKPVKQYVDSCIEKSAIEAIQLVGMQGGYVIPPNLSLETNYSTIAYHYYDRKYAAPSKETIENEISKAIGLTLGDCLDNFSSFRKQNYNITTENIEAETIIGNDDVLVKVEYPISIIKDETRTEVSQFSASAPIRLLHIYEIAQQAIAKTMQDPEWIDMTFLSSFDLAIDILPNDEESLVYTISDPISAVDDQPYKFLFAAHYLVNQPPILTIPDELVFKDAEAAIYQVNASDPESDQLTFSDDTALFDISEDGIILFTPEIPGNYDVTITVEDNHNNVVSKQVRFKIIE